MSELYCKWPHPVKLHKAVRGCGFWDLRDKVEIGKWAGPGAIMNCGNCRHYVNIPESTCRIEDVLLKCYTAGRCD